MTRVRTDNVFGTLTDSPLTAAATTMNSAGLANLAAVASAEAIIVLDPNRVSGAPEIVVVTAHTGSATSATIVRGQFGTAAREHAAGTEWVHGPIASNATSYATAADDQGDYIPINGWEPWTPTLTNLTVGNGSVTARFVRTGTTIRFRFRFLLGTTSAVGSAPTFSLPVAAHSGYVVGTQGDAIGVARHRDTGTADYNGSAILQTSSTVRPIVHTAGGTYVAAADVNGTIPMTWANTDALYVTGFYEAAS